MDFILYLVCFVALTVRCYNEQKWYWFGVYVCLAVLGMIQLIRLYLKLG